MKKKKVIPQKFIKAARAANNYIDWLYNTNRLTTAEYKKLLTLTTNYVLTAIES